MSNIPTDPVEQFWDGLLSRRPERIRAVFIPLDPATRQAVLAHLQRMVTEKDWHPQQRASARAALKVIARLPA